MSDIPKAVGIVWYKNEADYKKALSIFEDSFKLPATYEAFLRRFAEAVAIQERSEAIVVRAELDPETFSDWCAARSLHVDATGRAEWGNWKAAEYLREKGIFHEKSPL
jgi:hypothetical protein